MFQSTLQCFLTFFFLIRLGNSSTCHICSTPNIENHYGSFFENPREIQESFHGKVMDCRRNEFKIQECSGPCFSLNVSSSINYESDFGSSYGCSTNILFDEIDPDSENSCFTKTIPIRTSPIYLVTATYCTCSKPNCNPPIHRVFNERRIGSTSKSKFLSQNLNEIENFSKCFDFLLIFSIFSTFQAYLFR